MSTQTGDYHIVTTISRYLIAVILGIATTILIAIGFAAFGTVGSSVHQRQVHPTRPWMAAEYAGVGLRAVSLCQPALPRNVAPETEEKLLQEKFALLRAGLHVGGAGDIKLPLQYSPRWANDERQLGRSSAVTGRWNSWRVWGTGWPVVALRGVEAGGPFPFSLGMSHRAFDFMGFGETMPRSGLVDMRPWWPGFLLDTALFTAIWVVLFLMTRQARQRWRVRRGRCPLCAYILTEGIASGCSECGWKRSQSAL